MGSVRVFFRNNKNNIFFFLRPLLYPLHNSLCFDPISDSPGPRPHLQSGEEARAGKQQISKSIRVVGGNWTWRLCGSGPWSHHSSLWDLEYVAQALCLSFLFSTRGVIVPAQTNTTTAEMEGDEQANAFSFTKCHMHTSNQAAWHHGSEQGFGCQRDLSVSPSSVWPWASGLTFLVFRFNSYEIQIVAEPIY